VVIKLSKFALGIFSFVALTLLIIFSSDISQAVSDGVSICLNILIPSLFVFLILSDFFIQTGWLSHILKPFSFICSKLFHIHSSLGSVVFMSLVCGYPVGAKLIAQMVEAKTISDKLGERLLTFCVNAGPAFLIGGVAIPVFSSLKLGLIIFISHVTAFFIVGICSGIGKKAENLKVLTTTTAPSKALVSSVSSATKAMVNICAFVLLFSGILGMLKQIGFFNMLENIFSDFIPPGSASAIVAGILEVSSGVFLVKEVVGALSFFIVVAVTAFGGICVHLQIRSILCKTKISMKPFYLYRILYLLISLITSAILFYFVGDTEAVFSTVSNIDISADHGNPFASVLLLIFSAFVCTKLCMD